MHGDLSRIANGFRYWGCDGTIQEAALGDGLMVKGGSYGFVKSFYYLGDTLDGNGADLAATSRIRNGLMKFRELLPFLISRAHRLERKAQVYDC